MEQPRRKFLYGGRTMCASVIPFIPSLNDQNQLSFLKRISKLKLPNICETCVVFALY